MQIIDVNAVALAEAEKQMHKPAQVKTATLLVALAKFVNDSKRGNAWTIGSDFPTVTVSRLKTIVNGNAELKNKVWPVKMDEIGVCVVNVTPAPAESSK